LKSWRGTRGQAMTEGKQGSRANRSGKTLEKSIVSILQTKGFAVVPYRSYTKNPSRHGTELLLCNAPYQTIYGHLGTTEFLLESQKLNLRIRIECKWQQTSGSVDEKFPYVYLNCIEAMPEKDIIIVADGTGAKAGAMKWLREAVAAKRYTDSSNDDKTVRVMSIVEFMTWANKTFVE